jgi:hypothetical protein
MVMALFRGMFRPDPQYSVISVREIKYTRLEYRTRLNRLHTLYPHLALAFLRSSHSVTLYPEQENYQGTSDKLHVPQADPSVIGMHNSTSGETGKK